MGLDLGVYDSTGGGCAAAFTNTAAKTGTVLSEAATATGTFCVNVYDIGNVTPGSPVTYTLTVAHP